MPDLVPLVVTAAVVGAATASALAASAYTRRRFEAIEAAWRRYAERAGMRFAPAPVWPFASAPGPSLRGESHGVPVHVGVEVAGELLETHVAATIPAAADDFVFVIHRRGAPPRTLPALGGVEETTTGNKVFDADFALLSNDPDVARSILDRRLAHVLGGFPRDKAYVHATGNRFALRWGGLESDFEVLDAAVQIVWTACRRRA